VRQRALVLVTGPTGSGKTTLIEQLLRSERGMLLAARCIRDDSLRGPKEAVPRSHGELRRYRKAGASGVVEYRFPRSHADLDAFFTTRFMEDYSEGVLLEGDPPFEYLDLTVFVAPALPGNESLFRRVTRDRAREKLEALTAVEKLLETPRGTEELLATVVSRAFVDLIRANPGNFEETRASFVAHLKRERAAPPPASTKHWAIAAGYEGIEHAQVGVVNVHNADERPGAQRLVNDLVRLRKDEAIFRDVLGWRGHRIPITAVVADLADPGDPGLKKTLARIRRAFRLASD
jgi:adenylate kinase